MAGVKGVPVIPTAGAALEGTRSKVGGISSGRERAHCTGGDDLHGTVGEQLCRTAVPCTLFLTGGKPALRSG